MFLTVIRRKFFKELTITGIVLTALVGGIYYWIIPTGTFLGSRPFLYSSTSFRASYT